MRWKENNQTDATCNTANFPGALQSDKQKWAAVAAFLGESACILEESATSRQRVAPKSQTSVCKQMKKPRFSTAGQHSGRPVGTPRYQTRSTRRRF
jgi:hypothetical protein